MKYEEDADIYLSPMEIGILYRLCLATRVSRLLEADVIAPDQAGAFYRLEWRLKAWLERQRRPHGRIE